MALAQALLTLELGMRRWGSSQQRNKATQSAGVEQSKQVTSRNPGKKGRQIPVLPGRSVGTWGDRVRTHAPNLDRITEEVARGSHMVEGVWNPMHQKQLIGTLMTDWDSKDVHPWTPDEIAMR
ncbi:hypothetical protein PF002_g19457 [Phytophthora fragariae]|uniref:Uncharacterized protein n=1 Tax=Phytophthora fragariae TaxID=53985 RepID=A0A6A3XVZ1_9STRA|nr:hypothetical protein PF002_g19457 [Phytophthora fragariae]